MEYADSDNEGEGESSGGRAIGSASYFLKIDGIRGESQDRQHRDEIELQSFAWGNSSAEPQGGASGTASGKVTFQDFQFAAPASKAGPQLMLHCATGKHIPRAVMTGRKEALRAKNEYFLRIMLADVLVASYVSSGSSGDGGAPMDTATEVREYRGGVGGNEGRW